MDQINQSGLKAARMFKNITYWTPDWRKIKVLKIC